MSAIQELVKRLEALKKECVANSYYAVSIKMDGIIALAAEESKAVNAQGATAIEYIVGDGIIDINDYVAGKYTLVIQGPQEATEKNTAVLSLHPATPQHLSLKDYVKGLPHKEQDEIRKQLDVLKGEATPPQEEPLAVLAERKGVYISSCRHRGANWWIHFDAPKETIVLSDGLFQAYTGETYAEAEQKARAYLNGLPDKENNGKR